mgnify:CR=1 FL=1
MSTIATRRVESPNAPPSTGYRSQAIDHDGYLFCGGQVGAPFTGEPISADRVVSGPLAEQVRICLEHLRAVTDTAGGDRTVVEVSAFIAQPDSRAEVERVVADFLGHPPAVLHYEEVETVALRGLVEMDWIAVPADRVATAAEVVAPMGSHDRPGEIVRSGSFTLVNGLLGHGDTLGEATEHVFAVAARTLATVDLELADILKMTVFIDEFDTYPQFNEATKAILDDDLPPTRSVLVAPAITGSARIRIDVVAR